MELTKSQQEAIVNYLKANKAFNTHIDHAKTGYNSKLNENVKSSINEMKKLFSEDEMTFLTSAAYLPELEKHFLGGK